RLQRTVEDYALVNWLGFPSRGVDFVARRLARRHSDAPVIGISIGKGATTSIDNAEADYLGLLERLAPLADYLVINVSSPNTPGLRRLEAGARLGELLVALTRRRDELVFRRSLPLLVKLSPDLGDRGLDDALEAIDRAGMDGVVATNTTMRPEGGLSGAPLTELATQTVAEIHKRTGGTLPIVASGGVMSAADALAKVEAGASLVQVYTGLVYRGPRLISEITAALG
ncbi:MAG: dihydroorotate dehydrogenase (quinone), partial [Acidimicrobiia bacterium]